MAVIEFSKDVDPATLHEELLNAIPALRPIEVNGGRRAVVFLEHGPGFVRVTFPDDLSASERETISAVVSSHDALAALRARKVRQIKAEAHALLVPTDWLIVRNVENGRPVPQALLDYRAAVRAATDRAEQEIAVLTDVEAVRAYRVEWPPKPEGIVL